MLYDLRKICEGGHGIVLMLLLHRKTLLLATGIVVAGGTAAYVQSRLNHKKLAFHGHYNGLNDSEEITEKALLNDHKLKKPPRKKGGLKSLQVLAAILLSEMGQMGVRDLLSLLSIVVSLWSVHIICQKLDLLCRILLTYCYCFLFLVVSKCPLV